MAVNVSVITRLTGVQQVTGGLRSIGGGLDKISVKARLAAKSLQVTGQRISSLGTTLAIGITVPLALATGALINFAAQAVESENLFEISMGGMAKAAREFSEELRTTLGLNAFEVRKQIGVFQQMFVSMGLSTEAAFAMSKGMTRLTQDMASFFNLPTDEAFRKLQSGITGEIEPLKRLGIIVNETTIKQLALTLGIIKGNEALTEAQKVAVRYIAILDRTGNAQGDLARTLDSPINRMRILGAQFEELAIKMGSEFLPILASVIGGIQSLIPMMTGWIASFSALTPAAKGLTVAIGALVIAAGPLLFIVGKLVTLLGLLLTTMIVIVSPIGAVAIAITAVVVAGVLLSTQWDKLVESAAIAWSSIKLTILENVLAIVDALDGTIAKFLGFDDNLAGVRERIASLIDDEVLDRINEGSGTLADTMEDVFDGILKTIDENMEEAKKLLASPFEAMGRSAEEAIKKVQDAMAKTKQVILEEIVRLGEVAEKTDTKRLKARQKLEDKAKALALATLEFEISIGQKTLEEKVKFLEAELAVTEEGTKKQLALRKLIASAQLEIFRRDLELARKSFDNNELLMQKFLQNQKSRFEALGEAGGLAAVEINRSLTGVGIASIDMARIMQSSFTAGLTNMLQGGISFGQGMKSIFRSIANSILAEFARIAVSRVFQILFGNAALGAQAGQQVLAAGGGSLLGGGEGGGTAIVGGLGVVGSLISGVTLAGAQGAAAIGLAIGGAELGATLGNLVLGGFATPILAGVLNLISGNVSGAIGSVVLGTVGAFLGGPVGAAIGSFIGGFFPHGGSFITQRPQLIGVGERGAEEVTIRPLGGAPARSGGGITLMFSGINVFDGIAAEQAARTINRALIREQGRTV